MAEHDEDNPYGTKTFDVDGETIYDDDELISPVVQVRDDPADPAPWDTGTPVATHNDMVAEIARLTKLTTPHCMQCGYELQRGDPDLKAKLVKHIAEDCPHHPFRQVMDDNVRLTKQRDMLLLAGRAALMKFQRSPLDRISMAGDMLREAIKTCS